MALKVMLLRHKLHGSNLDSPLLCNDFSNALNYKVNYGVIWAFRAELSGTMIQELSFWKSSAYLSYLEPNMALTFGASCLIFYF